MAHIKTPKPYEEKIKSLADFLGIAGQWQKEQESAGDGDGFLSQLWYRGVNQQFPTQAPGVYRPDFTERAMRLKKVGDDESKRLHLECEMLSEFRIAGATYLNHKGLVETYFAAQHFGMPTRLLDWSTNPLAGLFFACDGPSDKDGVVYAMDATRIIPPKAMRTKNEKLYHSVMSMRHPFVEYAIGLSFWQKPKPDHEPHILPVRPEVVAGRIGQQSSCFTMHMHGAKPADNSSLIAILIDASSKIKIGNELHRMNINQFTIYSDLDHLSKEIKSRWGLK